MSNGIHKIALTGGIASGKSEVGRFLTSQGVPVIDADDVTHRLLETDETIKTNIRNEFGTDVFDPQGRVDRKKLGRKVFGFPDKKKLLESWIHPKVRLAIQGFFEAQYQKAHKFAVAIIPLLFESNLEQHYDEIWLIRTDPERQIERMMKYRQIDGRPMTREEAEVRIRSQMPMADKLARLQAFQAQGKPGAVIENSTDLQALHSQVLALLKRT